MKIVIFGIGEFYRKNKKSIAQNDVIVAFLDNNEKVQGETREGIRIHSPVQIHKINYDKIIIMSNYAVEMKEQLLHLGCQRDKILHFAEYLSRQNVGKLGIYSYEAIIQEDMPICICDFADNKKKVNKCLIITSSLGYHGGSITVVYAALELQNRGYEAVVAAPDGDIQFMNEFRKKGITFFLYPNLRFARWEELSWIDDFQKIIVNTYPMLLCALEIGKYRRVLVWLHESDIVYPSMEFWKDRILEDMPSSQLYFYAVSDVARKNFAKNVKACTIRLLPYGIPDLKRKSEAQKDNKLTFALVGRIHPIKQQLLYLKAIKLLDEVYQRENEFLMIGEAGENEEYVNKVKQEIGTFRYKCVKCIKGLARKDMERIYSKIDVLVVASAQETMSLVATEAMMYGKTCIICDVAGMAEFVRHGENGLICRTGDAGSLAEHLTYCIRNRGMLNTIGTEARKTYCEYFTMKVFGDRLEKEIRNI